MTETEALKKDMEELFSRYPKVLHACTDISRSVYGDRYRSALVSAVPYDPQITDQDYSEPVFEGSIARARAVVDELVRDLSKVLALYGIRYYVPPVAQRDEMDLLAPFSFKYAAVSAGLGWIGKNDVLITKEYGPRVRLSAVLIDAGLPYGVRITKSLCPDACTICVNHCPHHALKGTAWDIEKMRGEIIDYHLCNEKRSLYIEKYGRKNACGLCMVSCPFGQVS